MFEIICSNKDIVLEIAVRLPPRDLMRLKCTSKTLNNLIDDPLLLRIHDQHCLSRDGVSGYLIHCHPFWRSEGQVHSKPSNIKDRIQLSTSHGILCSVKRRRCVKCEKFIIYIGSPMDDRHIRMKADPYLKDDTFVLAFDPFGSSSSSSFKLANIFRPEEKDDLYCFSTYSSVTKQWKISKRNLVSKYSIQGFKGVFASGCFHWLAYNRYVIAFDDEEEMCDEIQVPDYLSEHEDQRWRCDLQCIGESQDSLHYASTLEHEVKVWLMVDYFKSEWVIRYSLNVVGVTKEPRIKMTPIYGKRVEVICLSKDVLAMHIVDNQFFLYECKTGELKGVYSMGGRVLLHSHSLAALHALKELRRSGCYGHWVRHHRCSSKNPYQGIHTVSGGSSPYLSYRESIYSCSAYGPEFVEHVAKFGINGKRKWSA